MTVWCELTTTLWFRNSRPRPLPHRGPHLNPPPLPALPLSRKPPLHLTRHLHARGDTAGTQPGPCRWPGESAAGRPQPGHNDSTARLSTAPPGAAIPVRGWGPRGVPPAVPERTPHSRVLEHTDLRCCGRTQRLTPIAAGAAEVAPEPRSALRGFPRSGGRGPRSPTKPQRSRGQRRARPRPRGRSRSAATPTGRGALRGRGKGRRRRARLRR